MCGERCTLARELTDDGDYLHIGLRWSGIPEVQHDGATIGWTFGRVLADGNPADDRRVYAGGARAGRDACPPGFIQHLTIVRRRSRRRDDHARWPTPRRKQIDIHPLLAKRSRHLTSLERGCCLSLETALLSTGWRSRARGRPRSFTHATPEAYIRDISGCCHAPLRRRGGRRGRSAKLLKAHVIGQDAGRRRLRAPPRALLAKPWRSLSDRKRVLLALWAPPASVQDVSWRRPSHGRPSVWRGAMIRSI